jgi:hypothetical protein
MCGVYWFLWCHWIRVPAEPYVSFSAFFVCVCMCVFYCISCAPWNWLIRRLKIVLYILYISTISKSSLRISSLGVKHSNSLCFHQEAVAFRRIITLICLFIYKERFNRRVRKFYSEDLQNLLCSLNCIRWSNEKRWDGATCNVHGNILLWSKKFMGKNCTWKTYTQME